MANPMYSDRLQYAPTFRWGGREWGEGDLGAFMKKIGGPKKYKKWAARHRVAAKSFDPAEGFVYSQTQPIFTGIDAERKKKAEYYQRLMANLAGFTTALGPMLGAHAPAIGGAYREAAETMGAGGTAYGAALNNSTAAAAAGANEVLGSINAPQGQMLQGGDAGGVLAGLAGWIPETLLNTQGGAFAAAASQLPKSAAIESQYMMKDILDRAMEEEDDFSTEVLKVLQGVPGLRQEYKSTAQKNALLKQEMRAKQLEAERDWFLEQSKLALSLGKYGLSQQYAQMAQQRGQLSANSSAGLDASGNPKPGYHHDPSGDVVKDGWHIGKNGVPVKDKGTGGGSTSSTTPGTPAYKSKALKEVGKARTGIDKAIKAAMIPGSKIRGTPDTYPPYAVLYKQLYDAYDYLAVNPATKKALDRVIHNALAAKGIKPKATTGPKPPYPSQ